MVEIGLSVVHKLTRWSKFVLEKPVVAKLIKLSRTFLWNRRFPTELAIVIILSQMNPVHTLTPKCPYTEVSQIILSLQFCHIKLYTNIGVARGGVSGTTALGNRVQGAAKWTENLIL